VQLMQLAHKDINIWDTLELGLQTHL